METGMIIKSSNFNINPYWVIRCDNTNLKGNRNGELPIYPLSIPTEYPVFMGRCYPNTLLGRKVNFKIVKIGNDKRLMYYAKIIE